MTKIIILGEEPKEANKRKQIEFVKFMGISSSLENAIRTSDLFENIELVCRNYRDDVYDLMFAYNDDRLKGFLYLGFFNDGVVR